MASNDYHFITTWAIGPVPMNARMASVTTITQPVPRVGAATRCCAGTSAPEAWAGPPG